ncbi:MAG: hypothetical protein RL095_2160 [Verrucomicrobiota bacterium]|jgi:hypothetical protein
MRHHLKTLPDAWSAVNDGSKRAELRWNDRNYQTHDILALCEWKPETGYTRRTLQVVVTHVFDCAAIGLPGWVLLSID